MKGWLPWLCPDLQGLFLLFFSCLNHVFMGEVRKIAEDNEFLLVNVTLFKKHLDEFVNRCREERSPYFSLLFLTITDRFVVRDFTFQEGKADFELRELAEYKSSRLEARQQLREWLCTNFSDAFSSWVHIKIMRVFTESVLRYGLPADYLISMLVVSFLFPCLYFPFV